jgi:hypothetical protein
VAKPRADDEFGSAVIAGFHEIPLSAKLVSCLRWVPEIVLNILSYFSHMKSFPGILYRKPTAKVSRCKNKSYRRMLGFAGVAQGKNYQGAAVKFPYWAGEEEPRPAPNLSRLLPRVIPDIG